MSMFLRVPHFANEVDSNEYCKSRDVVHVLQIKQRYGYDGMKYSGTSVAICARIQTLAAQLICQ